jgi:hypothetical protein
MTRDVRVGGDESMRRNEMLKPPQEYHIAQEKKQFKFSSNRNVFQAALVV